MKAKRFALFLFLSTLLLTVWSQVYWNLINKLDEYSTLIEPASLESILFSLVTFFVIAFICGLFGLVACLHRQSGIRRFITVLGAGLCMSMISHASDLMGITGDLLNLQTKLGFEIVAWAILAIISSSFLTVKQRNIFRN